MVKIIRIKGPKDLRLKERIENCRKRVKINQIKDKIDHGTFVRNLKVRA
jgi:hypothetical protein